MKKIGAVLLIVAAMVALTNASVWEGAASSSSSRDLPETGYYAATNAFPRNTVVDITNLENGKTIRAVVSAPLENPGLLALLSKDAAAVIGIPERTIGRIRMNQSGDPAAFSRFGEALPSPGDPDRDPSAFVSGNRGAAGASVAEAPPVPEIPPAALPAPEAPPADEAAGSVAEAPAVPAAALPVPEAPPADEAGSSVAEAPAPEQTRAEDIDDLTIVDLPDDYIPPSDREDIAAVPEATIPDREAAPEIVPDLAWSPPAATEREDLMEPEPEGIADGYAGEAAPEIVPDLAWNPPAATEREDLTEPKPRDIADGYAGEAPAAAETPDAGAGTPRGEYGLALVPTEERPPASAAPAPALPALAARTPPPVSGDNNFPVPVIRELEAGKYYLQLAASRNSDAVKTELAKINGRWPLAVQVSEQAAFPYRILVGPVSQGESRALLQQIRMSYQDAFVRVGQN
ncbi:MAG: SPOR domain-containing protein [Treponema sp.]|jgi:hypothetical protein|nr:SPOR domain-containing protein [Treponema sp.]